MRWIVIVGATLVAIGGVLLVIGMWLPERHRVTLQERFAVPPDAVWAAITDVDAYPAWRGDVSRVERLPDRDGRRVWVEHGRSGALTLAVERSDAPRVLVVRIADPDLPFGGTWTYEIVAEPAGSLLRITEDGEVYNPFFRVMAKFVFGHESTLRSYLTALSAHVAAGAPDAGRP